MKDTPFFGQSYILGLTYLALLVFFIWIAQNWLYSSFADRSITVLTNTKGFSTFFVTKCYHVLISRKEFVFDFVQMSNLTIGELIYAWKVGLSGETWIFFQV